MKIVWDEHKRISNLDKHGLDFVDVGDVDWGTAIIEPTYGNRFKAIARLQDKTTVVIYALLGSEAISVISFRYANSRERRLYHDNKAQND